MTPAPSGFTTSIIGSTSFFQGLLASPPPIGSTTPNSGAFTTLTTTGNVGIGTTSPGYLLTVNGTGSFTGTLLANGGTVLSSVTNPANNPITGTPSSSTYLRGDGTWVTSISNAVVTATGSTTARTLGDWTADLSGLGAAVPYSPDFLASTIANSYIIQVKGTAASPISTPQSSIVGVLYSSYGPGIGGATNELQAPIVGIGHMYGTSAAGNKNNRGGFFEGVDWIGNTGLMVGGNNFVEGSRSQGVAGSGANYTATYGGISYANGAITPLQHMFIVGHEAQVDNQYAAAPVPTYFNKWQFSASFNASTGESSGTFTADAAYLINPFNPNLYMSGLLVPAGTVNNSAVALGTGVGPVYGFNALFATGMYAIIAAPNNVAVIRAMNASATSQLNLLSLNGSNQLVLGGDVTSGTIVSIRDTSLSNSISREVLYGAANSAGAGYRTISVPN